MDDIHQLMVELDGADAETVKRVAATRGSLLVRLAMLGLAVVRKGASPLWWGYPPGVFIGYKWDGDAMLERVEALASYVRARGYRTYLDREHLDADADAYFQIPEFIASVQECSFYVLLLTSRAADLIDARHNKTSWIHDEVQQAIRLTNAGSLFMVPVLLEPDGMIDALRGSPVIDLTADPRGYGALDDVLTADPLAVDESQVASLREHMATFDALFLASQWDASASQLAHASAFRATFDHGFRRMLQALYTADGPSFMVEFNQLCAEHGRNIVMHLYTRYCTRHGIPARIQAG